ncbi:MAG: hypothetical protein U9P44_01035 [archaeon]|nr:hypothetical protein [archaeon]
MVILYQTFNLRLPGESEIDEPGETDLNSLNLQTMQMLIDKLRNKGYEILKSDDLYSGVPESIIIGGELNMNLKDAFFSIAEKLGLKYRSEYFYRKID